MTQPAYFCPFCSSPSKHSKCQTCGRDAHDSPEPERTGREKWQVNDIKLPDRDSQSSERTEPPIKILGGGSFANSASSDAPPRRTSVFLVLGVLGGIGVFFLTAIVIVGFLIASLFAPQDPPEASTQEALPQPPRRPAHTLDLEKMESTEEVRRVRRSTVLIVYDDWIGNSGRGSGFLVGEKGFVLTNAHVLGYGPTEIRASVRYKVFFNFGLPDQRVIMATIHGVDVERNLALLKLASPDLPPPLALKSTANIKEMDELLTFGPARGKPISMQKMIVSGLTRENGQVKKVRLDGELGYEMFGGPVTNQEGDVVGVCVADILGTPINHAIPAEIAREFVREQIASGGTTNFGGLKVMPGMKKEEPKRELQPFPNDNSPSVPWNEPKKEFQPPSNPNFPPAQWNEPKREFQPPSNPVPFPRVIKSDDLRPTEAKVAKPMVAMRLAPVVPVEITPAPFTGEKIETKLPSTVADACVGGGGRYICMLLPTNRQVAVYDVSLAKIVKYFPVEAEDARIAAGMNKLLVLTPEPATITRYDFAKMEKEVTEPAPFKGVVKAVAMGSASAGPLLVHYSKGTDALDQAPVMFIDPYTLKEFGVGSEKDVSVKSFGLFHRDKMHFRASPDGRIFGAWCTSHTPSGLKAIRLEENSIDFPSAHKSVGHVVPGPDGTLFTAHGRHVAERHSVGTLDHGEFGRPLIPATSGSQFLELIPQKVNEHGIMDRNGQTEMTVTVRLENSGQLRPSLTKLDLPGNEEWLQHDFSIDKRLVFVPGAKAVVVIPSSNDRLVSHRFDMKEAMDKSGVVYLYVDSSPPPTFVPGRPFEYQIMARSKKGGVKYKLESGPGGMKVSLDGKVTWLPAKDWSVPQSVTISVSDASRQEIFHAFRLIPGEPPSEIAMPAKSDAKTKAEPRPQIKAELKPETKNEAAAGDEIIQTPSFIFPIKPTEVADNSSVTLPGPADAICVAGGGRFLVYRIPSLRELVLFDVTLAKIVKEIPISDEKALFAGGMTKLFILNPTANVFQQWDLVRMEKDANAVNPAGGKPRQLLVGHRTDGPVFICGPGVGDESRNFALLNTKTWKPADDSVFKPLGNFVRGGFATHDRQRDILMRASADGRVFAGSDQQAFYGIYSLVIGSKEVKFYSEARLKSPVLPGPDGALFSLSGIYSPELKEIIRNQKFGCFPAISGSWYFELRFPDGWGFPRQVGTPPLSPPQLVPKLRGDDRPLLILFDLDCLDSPTAFNSNIGALGMADRIQMIPEANLLVVLNAAGTKLHLRRLDLKARLAKSDVDYLFVVSRPPETATRGAKFNYTPEVWSKKGGVKIKVATGPEGMRESNGVVSWDVPADAKKGDHEIILTASDTSGQESFHSFRLTVKD